MKIKLEKDGVVYDEAIIIILGDINCDGKVDMRDNQVAARISLKLDPIITEIFYAYDVDEDEKFSAADYSAIGRLSLKI
jgi:hypothetical protein